MRKNKNPFFLPFHLLVNGSCLLGATEETAVVCSSSYIPHARLIKCTRVEQRSALCASRVRLSCLSASAAGIIFRQVVPQLGRRVKLGQFDRRGSSSWRKPRLMLVCVLMWFSTDGWAHRTCTVLRYKHIIPMCESTRTCNLEDSLCPPAAAGVPMFH